MRECDREDKSKLQIFDINIISVFRRLRVELEFCVGCLL